MGVPLYGDDQFQFAFKAIMPSGDVWSDDPNGIMNLTIAGLQPTSTHVAQRASDLLQEVVPSTTDELLPDWEASLGLPDPCAGASPTFEIRRAQVVARIAATGGQSIAYMTELAANLGYTITINQFASFRAGRGRAGQPLCGDAWANAWQVNAPTFTVNRFKAGSSCAGEPLASWGNSVLQCELQRVAPAHTQLLFSYD